MTRTHLLLFLAIATILIASPFASGSVFADKDEDKKDDKENKKDDKEKQNKKDEKKDNPFQALWDAISGMQSQIDSFFDIFTELQNTDDDLQSQIDALSQTAGPPGPPGPPGPQGETGPAGTFQTQTCPQGEVMIGIESTGTIICSSTSSDATSCDPDGSDGITGLELYDYLTPYIPDEITFTIVDAQSQIVYEENNAYDSNQNGIIDTYEELGRLNVTLETWGVPACEVDVPAPMCISSTECASEINAISFCYSGQCTYVCNRGFSDLNGNLGLGMDGCESIAP